MSLTIPASTKHILDAIEAERQPTVEYQIAAKLSGLHQAEIRRIFSTLDYIRNGMVEQVEVRAGVPRRIVFKDGEPMHR